MFIQAATLDDLLMDVYQTLQKSTTKVQATRGNTIEQVGALLKLENPRARLSRSEGRGKVFSAIGELLWYLAADNTVSFISYYIQKYTEESDDGTTIHGAYGPRLLNKNGSINQIENVIALLKEKKSSRRAVIQLFDAEDICKTYKEIPCTCTLQFLIRNEKLHLVTYMRSNDAVLGLPHDVFTFTMLQEIIARKLNVELGTYTHSVGSLHIYETHLSSIQQYINEGFHTTLSPMPAMPMGNPSLSVSTLLDTEQKIRTSVDVDIQSLNLDPYWADLARLLKVLSYGRSKNSAGLEILKSQMYSKVFDVYINQYLAKAT